MWGILNDAFTQFHVLADESFSVFIKCWEGRLTVRMGVRLRLCVAVRTHQLAFKYFSNIPNHFLISKYFSEGKSFPTKTPVYLAPRTSSHQLIKCSYKRGLIISLYPWVLGGVLKARIPIMHWSFFFTTSKLFKVHWRPCFYIEIDKSCSFPWKCNFIEVEAEQSWVKGKSYFRFTRQ